MVPKHLCLLILAVVACAAAQSDDDIPVENDNQFPPDNHTEDEGAIDGSGQGTIDEPYDITTTQASVKLEDVQPSSTAENEQIPLEQEDTSCPNPCVCHIEGDSGEFVVDCSGYDLTEIPSPIDIKTTTLNIQNNKLTEISKKEISTLKNLKVLNANDNSIMDLESGSISELPELAILKLANNRLIEFPKDLKNSFGLTKLEELDLGGNDMRTTLNKDAFSSFTALRKLTLPTSTTDLLEDLCSALKENLEYICTESCSTQSFDCPDAPAITNEDDLLSVILPGTIALMSTVNNDNVDPSVFDNLNNNNLDATVAKEEAPEDSATGSPSNPNENTADPSEIYIRKSVSKAESTGISPLSTLVEAPKAAEDENKETHDVSVGATTSSTNTGGVNKSVIGLVVAGMVLVVAGITIKKNWSSIKNKFSSSPRPANDRTPHTNGSAAPEEVPLQDNKSPV